jgi:hypothetical protein
MTNDNWICAQNPFIKNMNMNSNFLENKKWENGAGKLIVFPVDMPAICLLLWTIFFIKKAKKLFLHEATGGSYSITCFCFKCVLPLEKHTFVLYFSIFLRKKGTTLLPSVPTRAWS